MKQIKQWKKKYYYGDNNPTHALLVEQVSCKIVGGKRKDPVWVLHDKIIYQPLSSCMMNPSTTIGTNVCD